MYYCGTIKNIFGQNVKLDKFITNKNSSSKYLNIFSFN